MPAEQVISIWGPMPVAALAQLSSNDDCWVDAPDADAFAQVQQALNARGSRLTLKELNQALAKSKSAREFRRWMAHAQRHAARDEMPLLVAFQRYFDRLATSN